MTYNPTGTAAWRTGAKSKGFTIPTLKAVLNFPILAISARHISKEVCETYRVRTQLHETSLEPIAHYFPITKGGKIKGYAGRRLDIPKGDDAFFYVGDVNPTCDLLGMHTVKGNREVIITEGLYDFLSIAESHKLHKNTDFACNVVSIGFGTLYAKDHVKSNLPELSKFEKIVTCFDSDRCNEEESSRGWKRGHEATEEVQLLLGDQGRYVELDEGMDPSDYLQDERSRDLFFLSIQPKEWKHGKLVYGSPVTMEKLLTPIAKGITLDVFPMLEERLKGFRPNELTVLLAPVKAGKSTIVKHMVHGMLKSGIPNTVASLEDTDEALLWNIAAIVAGVEPLTLMEDPLKYEASIKQVYKLYNNKTNSIISSQRGKISPKQIVELCKSAALNGSKLLLIDHFSYIMSGDVSNDERKAFDNMLTELESLVKQYPIHILGVSHINFDAGYHSKMIQACVKNEEEGYWYVPNFADSRGSKIFGQVCANIITVDKFMRVDKNTQYTRLNLELSRRGRTGVAEILTYKDGRLKAI